MKTRFVRIFVIDNHGGDDIRINGVGFYGVDMRLVAILRDYGLEGSLPGLLSHVRTKTDENQARTFQIFQGINDLEALDEKRDEILNSSVGRRRNERFSFCFTCSA